MSLMQNVKDAYELANTVANAEQKSELLGLLLSAREDASALQEENSELKEQIKSFDRFEESMKEYSPEKVHKCIVYKHKTKPDWYACPHCTDKDRQIHHLQPFTKIQHRCSSCGELFQLHPDETDYSKGVNIDVCS